MFNTKFNEKTKNASFESSDDAIKRGIKVQTTFLTKREKKAKLELLVNSDKHIDAKDCYDAETYHQMQLIKFIQAKRA